MTSAKDISSTDVKAFIKELKISKIKTSKFKGGESESIKANNASGNVPKAAKRRKNADSTDLVEETAAKKTVTEVPHIAKNKSKELNDINYWNNLDEANRKSSRVLVKDYEKWFSILSTDFDSLKRGETVKMDEDTYIEIESFAERLYQADVQNFKNSPFAKSKWKSELSVSGTRRDQINAKCSLFETSTIHQIDLLDYLVNLIRKGKLRKGAQNSATGLQQKEGTSSREEVLAALDALEHLWLQFLLPDRKFICFKERPLFDLPSLSQNDSHVRNIIIIIWYFEDLLMGRFKVFLRNIEFCLHDTVEKIRERAIKVLLQLLSAKPHLDDEVDFNILNLLVDKTGDPNRKVAAYASRCATSLLIKHSSLKLPLIIEAEKVMFRFNKRSIKEVNAKASHSNAIHYCVCFLNQIVLSKSEHQIAERLMSIYLNVFKPNSSTFGCFLSDDGFVENQNELKILTNVLTGIHRAMPYCKSQDNKQLLDQINILFKIVHTKKINTSVQALMILFEISGENRAIADRFFNTLYKKLVQPGFTQSHNLSLFFNLLYKSLKRDSRSLEGNRRIPAFKKRLLQLSLIGGTGFASGVLCLLSQFGEKALKKKASSLKNDAKLCDKTAVDRKTLELSDDEEYFEDYDAEGHRRRKSKDSSQKHALKAQDDSTDLDGLKYTNGENMLYGNSYKPRCLNPLYSGADSCPIWETYLLLDHYHPSVAAFSKQVLKGVPIEYAGDPLADFATARFIEKYCGKKPKALSKSQPLSPMAPRLKTFMPGVIDKVLNEGMGDENNYLETYSKLCQELKATSAKYSKKSGDSDDEMEDLNSDDEDFDEFLNELDEQQFKEASGGVDLQDLLPDDMEDDNEDVDEFSDNLESDDNALDSDFALQNDEGDYSDDNSNKDPMEDDDLFL